MNNKLRRTKTKLALFEIEGIFGLMGDLLECVEVGSTSTQIQLFQELKMQYMQTIKELEEPDLEQQKLFQ